MNVIKSCVFANFSLLSLPLDSYPPMETGREETYQLFHDYISKG